MSRKNGFLFLVLVLLVQSAAAQYFNFYSGDNALGESLYGLKDEHGLEITKPIWKSHYKYEVFQFGEPLGVVSEDGDNYFLINLLGERVSLFTFSESYFVEDVRMIYSGDMKVDYGYLTDNNVEHINYYYLNEECACDPRPYFPCPARFPMDTANASEVIKQVQQMQFVLEFYTIDSAFAVCNELIDKNPRIPEYHFYKAWLIDNAFVYSYSLFMGDDYDEEYPKYMWDELIRLNDKELIGEDEKLQTYLEQYEMLQVEIKKLEKRGNWLERNKKYANQFIIDQDDYYAIDGIERYVDWEKNYELRKGSYYYAIDALIQMLIYEKEEEFVLKAKALQHQILGNFYWTHPSLDNQSGPFRTLYNKTEKELLENPHVYDVLMQEKVGAILRFNAASRNGELGFGFGLNPGYVTKEVQHIVLGFFCFIMLQIHLHKL